jgi:hypothetical protein
VHGSLATGRNPFRRNGPSVARHEQDPAVRGAPCAPVAGRKSTGAGPERRALSGSVPPTSTVLRVRAPLGRACGAPLTPEPLPTQRA